MSVRIAKSFHGLIGFGLLVCALCPFVEIVLHFNGSIFQHGSDTPSTLALLFLVFELSFALGRSLVSVLARVLKELCLIYFCVDRLTLPVLNCGIILPEVPPPLSLRI